MKCFSSLSRWRANVLFFSFPFFFPRILYNIYHVIRRLRTRMVKAHIVRIKAFTRFSQKRIRIKHQSQENTISREKHTGIDGGIMINSVDERTRESQTGVDGVCHSSWQHGLIKTNGRQWKAPADIKFESIRTDEKVYNNGPADSTE